MTRYRRAATGKPEVNDNGRIIRYVFSDGSIARDNHTINTAGWELKNFLLNPVFLWAHDSGALPIGRVVDIGIRGDQLVGDVEYLTRDKYAFADSVYELVRGGYLNATSVSWNPLEYKFSQDRGRPGGIDFIRQDLMEVSQVPVPALPTALATARAAGVDTQPMFEWAEMVLDKGGMRMIGRKDLENLRRASKMPVATKRSTRVAETPRKRGLYTVSYLADTLNSLGYLASSSKMEEEWEGDDSEVPAMLLESVKQLGQALVVMTIEEVNELLAGLSGVDPDDLAGDEAEVVYMAAAKTPAQRALALLQVRMSAAGAVSLPISGQALRLFAASLKRSGRVLSAANEKTLRSAHGQISDACDAILGICDQATGDDDTGDDDAETERRARRARALQARARAGLLANTEAEAA